MTNGILVFISPIAVFKLFYFTAGNIEEAIGHFINFVHFSGNPRTTLSTLQQTMPAPLFSLLVRAYATLQSEVSLYKPNAALV